jgi:hypothetical protein
MQYPKSPILTVIRSNTATVGGIKVRISRVRAADMVVLRK